MVNTFRKCSVLVIAVMTAVFALFPLTDTDIWWHLACARQWVTTWTPVREPVVNVHYFFQQTVDVIYGIGGASLLVYFKAILWGIVFALFLLPQSTDGKHRSIVRYAFVIGLLFLFRYQLEIRPVVFSLLFLGVYWNLLPVLFRRNEPSLGSKNFSWSCLLPKVAVGIILLVIQWVWCKTQGLFILGSLFAACVFLVEMCKVGETRRRLLPWGVFPLLLFLMPFLHREGLSLFLYPLGLLDRLLGLTPSATLFASQIAENRSPVTLLLAGENTLVSFGMVFFTFVSVGHEVLRILILRRQVLQESSRSILHHFILLVTAILALVAERNFVLFLPVLLSLLLKGSDYANSLFNVRLSRSIPTAIPAPAPEAENTCSATSVIPASEPGSDILSLKQKHFLRVLSLVFVAFLSGLWFRSFQLYDQTMVAYQRVPVAAAQWMKAHPHSGRLFNDDRAGGYLAFVNPQDSIYMDGRFILKTADFFERYLHFAEAPEDFLKYADSTGIDRAIFPLRYYARWENVINILQNSPQLESPQVPLAQSGLDSQACQEAECSVESSPSQTTWRLVYRDEYFAIFDR